MSFTEFWNTVHALLGPDLCLVYALFTPYSSSDMLSASTGLLQEAPEVEGVEGVKGVKWKQWNYCRNGPYLLWRFSRDGLLKR